MATHYDQDNQDVSLLAFDQYMHFVRWQPRLTYEEEARLVGRVEAGKRERVKVSPDGRILENARQARDELVAQFQPLVVHIAKHYSRRCQTMELLDLVQEGNIGLLEAIEKNKVSKGLILRPLASTCIGQAIWDALRLRDAHVALPDRGTKMLSRMRKIERQLQQTLKRDPSLAEIAAQLGVSEKKLRELREMQETFEVCSLQEMLVAQEAEDRYRFVSVFQQETEAERIHQEVLEAGLYEALNTCLSEDERMVIHSRYFLDGQPTKSRYNTEIGKKLGMHRLMVRKHEDRALARLREVLPSLCGLDEEEVA